MTKRRHAVPDGTAARDAWGAAVIDAAAPTYAEEGRKGRGGREGRHPCECECACGASATDSQTRCYLCTQEIHHKCSRACGAYPASVVKHHGVTETLPAIPARSTCGGGRR